MGLDGGLITTRQDMTTKSTKKTRQEIEKEKNESNADSYWKMCALTGLLLQAPILISRSGSIFRKEDVLEAIVKKILPKRFKYLKHLKNSKEVDLRGANTLLEYVCPLSSKSPIPSSKESFVFLFSCGHLFCKDAFDLMCSDHVCPICGNKTDTSDIIELNCFQNHEWKK